MAGWSQDDYIERFRNGRVIAGSPMPTGPFSRMDDMELISFYKYLSTVSPVNLEQPYGIQEGDPDV